MVKLPTFLQLDVFIYFTFAYIEQSQLTMEDKDKYVQNAVLPPSSQTDSITVAAIPSSHFVEYSSKISPHDQFCLKALKRVSTSIQQWKELKYQQYFVKEIQLKIVSESNNKEAIVANMQWGHFSINIKILNIRGSNTKHVHQKDRGAYGSIYTGKFNDHQFVIKCLPLQFKDSRFRAIKQWFLMKVASMARVGPKLKPYFGFDIIMFEECIEFAMEQCQKVTVHNSRLDCFNENLAILHKLHIVHQDLKPQNIMYSPSYDRPVFIDFGLSRIISENIGETTLTNYVGTVDYWSPEMGKCYLEKKALHIDLYYNDLYGLEKTIQKFKKMALYQTQNQFEVNMFSPECLIFQYLGLVLGKFYLLQNRFDDFMKLYAKIIEKADKSLTNLLQTEILYFFEELSPTKQVRSFFQTFTSAISEKHKQSHIYSKLKILYQLVLKAICSMEIFINEEKNVIFEKMSQELMFRGNQQLSQRNQNQNMAKFMINKGLIKETLFPRYLNMYLDYTSYTSDKYQVSYEKRQLAAKIYHQIFIGNASQSKMPRQLAGQTIIHALIWCLQQKKQSSYFNQIPYLIFKIYDFINYLDLGNEDQFLNWIDDIFNHHSMTKTYKIIFALRVEQSISLNMIRLLPKRQKSRFNFVRSIRNWLNQKKYSVFKQINFHSFCQDSKELYLPFQQEYAQEIIQLASSYFNNYNIIDRGRILIQFYYKNIGKKKDHKLTYLLPSIFQSISHYSQNSHLCKQIEYIFRTCIRDETIMEQFSFYLECELILNKIVYNKEIQFTVKDLQQVDQYLQRVSSEDLSLIQTSVVRIWNKIQQMQYEEDKDVSFVYQDNGFIRRYFQTKKQQYLKAVTNLNSKHECSQTGKFHYILSYSKKFQENTRKQVRSILEDEELWKKKGCQQCIDLKRLILLIDELSEYLRQYTQLFQNSSREILEQSATIFFNKYTELIKYIEDQKQMRFIKKDLFYVGLKYGQLLCMNQPNLEKKYGGIINNYYFCLNNGLLESYFIITETQFRLEVILQLLKTKGIIQMAIFLCELSKIFAKTLMVQWYHLFSCHFIRIIFTMSQEDLYSLFKSIRLTQKHKSNNNKKHESHYKNYLSLIYVCLFQLANDEPFLGRSMAATLKGIESLHYQFKRKVAISLNDKMFQLCFYRGMKRKSIKFRNKMVKLMMVDGITVQRKNYKLKGNIFNQKLSLKMLKIEEWNKVYPPVRFSNKFS